MSEPLADLVRAELAKAGVSGPTGIIVEEKPGGVIVLHGQVHAGSQARQAEEIARKVPGVRVVRNVIDSMDGP